MSKLALQTLRALVLPASISASAFGASVDPIPASEVRFDIAALATAIRGTPLPTGLSELDGSGLRLERSTVGDGATHLFFVDPARPGHSASLLLREGRLTGVIDHPNDLRERFTSRGAGVSVRTIADAERDPPCGGAMRGAQDPDVAAAPPIARLADGCDDGSTMDVLVVYTAAAMAEAGSREALLDEIDWAIADSNLVYANSGIPITIRLAAAIEATGYAESAVDMSADLDALTITNDGALDNVHALRNEVGADFVALVRSSGGGACGVAWLLDGSDTAGAYAFSVTARNCFGNRTFTHEIGHNMGCCHAPGDGGGCLDGGIYAYSLGHRFTASDGVEYRTVMAYQPGTRIPHFSSGTVTYSGSLTGIPNERDNARTITETRMTTANHRCEVEPIAGGGLAHAWGASDRGQASVPSSLRGVERVAAGQLHSVAVRSDGTVVCWGSNDYGQCSAPPSAEPIIEVDAGIRHTLALTQAGTVLAWGANEYGQSSVPGDLGQVSQIASGGFHSLARLANGSVRAWGQNNYNQCLTPSSVSTTQWIGAGASHSLAIRTDGSVTGWGRNDRGQTTTPASLGACSRVAGGDLHTVAIRIDGTVACWGNNTYGQCNVPSGLPAATEVAAGTSHTVALMASGSVAAWGRNNLGQTTVPADLAGVTSIDAGSNHSIARTSVVDCNSNGIRDSIELQSGAADVNGNGRLDACEQALGDLDLNGLIDDGDVALALLDFGPCTDCAADLDQSGAVDLGDVALILLNYGPTA